MKKELKEELTCYYKVIYKILKLDILSKDEVMDLVTMFMIVVTDLDPNSGYGDDLYDRLLNLNI